MDGIDIGETQCQASFIMTLDLFNSRSLIMVFSCF